MHKCDSHDGSMGEKKFWFAVKVRERFERNIADGMDGKDIETLLPMYAVKRGWSDRIKITEVPLFAGYVFCRIDPADRLPVLTIPGVHYFAGIGRAPEPIADSEIGSLLALVRSGAAAQPRPYLIEGESVRVEDGPLRGAEGILLRVGDTDQLVLSIQMLQRSVAVTLDRDSVAPLERARPATAPVRVAA
jgi:transcription antitermination factor NusG